MRLGEFFGSALLYTASAQCLRLSERFFHYCFAFYGTVCVFLMEQRLALSASLAVRVNVLHA